MLKFLTRAPKVAAGSVKPGLMRAIMNRAMQGVLAAQYSAHIERANVWRSQYNPLRGLTIARAATMLEEGERGAYAHLQWTYRFIEKRDATLGALVDRRMSAIQKLDWDIKVSDSVPEGAGEIAERQERILKAQYQNINGLRASIGELAHASFSGYTHLEKVRDASGMITDLQSLKPWMWCREGLDGAWQLNPESTFGVNRGVDVDADTLIIREVDRPINEVALICFVRKSLSQKDWDAFIETYGVPAVFLMMPPDLDADAQADFQEVAEQIQGDMRGSLPHGSSVETVDNGARGVNPFRDHIKYQDEQVVLRGTGGKLTMMSENTGLGSNLGDVQEAVFQEIAQAEAELISQLMQEHLDPDLMLQAGLGDEPMYVRFELAAREETDSGEYIKGVQTLESGGRRVSSAQITEKTGYEFEEVTPESESPDDRGDDRNAPTAADPAIADDVSEVDQVGDVSLLDAIGELVAVARREDASRLQSELGEALNAADNEIGPRLVALQERLPEFIDDDAAGRAAWERLISAALLAGWIAAGDVATETEVETATA